MSANGDKRLNRKVLERNALDILTAGEIAMDFEDALAWVESASKYELIRFLIDNNWKGQMNREISYYEALEY